MTIGLQNAANTIAQLTPGQRAQLEAAIAEINELRGGKGTAEWRAEWTAAHERAADAMGHNINQGGNGRGWNDLIDLLDAYRADWRGYIVPSLGRVAA